MKLRDYRKKKRLSQQAFAGKLEAFARQKPGYENIKLGQTTYGSWERNTMPRKFWLGILKEFTNSQVTIKDFAPAESPAISSAALQAHV